jgi:large subunit ribosomal protein L22
MEARAIARYVRVTPRKVDQVLQMIRGKRVDIATELLDFSPKHVAKVIGKVMKSAVANAVAMEGKINVEHMRVKEAVAQAGPTLKRFLPRAQGRATPILKRTSHILIIVEGDAVEAPAPARRPRGGAPGSGPKSRPVVTPEPKAAASSKPARGAAAGGRGAAAGKKKAPDSRSSKSPGSKSSKSSKSKGA